MAQHCFVIFGAAVKPDGSPSGTLQRRVEGAWRLSRATDQPLFLVTGGQGRFGPPEAQVMRQLLLDLGASDNQILLDEESSDTLDSAIRCAELIHAQGKAIATVTVCSSRYHNYRCQLLLRMLGVDCRRGAMPSDRPALGMFKWLYYWLREAAAIPWDVLLLALHRLRN